MPTPQPQHSLTDNQRWRRPKHHTMPTPESAPGRTTRLRRAIEIGALGLSALVAVGVAVLFLALTGAGLD